MENFPKRSYSLDDKEQFKTKAEFQAYRRKYVEWMLENMKWIILDPPEQQDATFVGKLDEIEYDRLHDEWIKSDPVNKALAEELKRLLTLIENGCPANEVE